MSKEYVFHDSPKNNEKTKKIVLGISSDKILFVYVDIDELNKVFNANMKTLMKKIYLNNHRTFNIDCLYSIDEIRTSYLDTLNIIQLYQVLTYIKDIEDLLHDFKDMLVDLIQHININNKIIDININELSYQNIVEEYCHLYLRLKGITSYNFNTEYIESVNFSLHKIIYFVSKIPVIKTDIEQNIAAKKHFSLDDVSIEIETSDDESYQPQYQTHTTNNLSLDLSNLEFIKYQAYLNTSKKT